MKSMRIVDDYRRLIDYGHTVAPGPDAEAMLLRDWALREQEDPMGRFLTAVGLLAYGHVDVADAILTWLPDWTEAGSPHEVCKLARILSELLPLPKSLDPLNRRDHDRIREWLNENSGSLVWNESIGLFEHNAPSSHDNDKGS